MNRTSFKLKRMLELDPNILQQYDRWEKESYKNMMIIEGGTFEEKLDLLFRSRPEDMIDRGTEVVAKLQLKEETLMDDV